MGLLKIILAVLALVYIYKFITKPDTIIIFLKETSSVVDSEPVAAKIGGVVFIGALMMLLFLAA